MITTQVSDNFSSLLESIYSRSVATKASKSIVNSIWDKRKAGKRLTVQECLDISGRYPDQLDEAREGAPVQNPHIVHEPGGLGIAFSINGKEYRYAHPTMSTPELFRKFIGRYNHGKEGFAAVNWLKSKSGAVCYQGCVEKNLCKEVRERMMNPPKGDD